MSSCDKGQDGETGSPGLRSPGLACKASRLISRPIIAVDVGGTKVAAAVITPRGRILIRDRQPTALSSAQALIDQIIAMVHGLSARSPQPVTAIGVSLPAALDTARGLVIWAPNLTDWRDIPLGAVLSEEFALPTALVFDGHAAVLGEHWRGAGRNARNVVFLTIGTGIGGGLVLDGRLYRGTSNLAGAAGWIVAAPRHIEDPRQRTRGTLESVAAGPGLVAATERALMDGATSRLSVPVTTYSILAAADTGDPLACAVLERAGQAVGYAVVGIVSLLNPDVLIIGGGLGMATSIYVDKARQAVDQSAQPVSGAVVRIGQAELGDDAPLLGAARFALRQHRG